jgi:hypothetical protein
MRPLSTKRADESRTEMLLRAEEQSEAESDGQLLKNDQIHAHIISILVAGVPAVTE